MFLFVVIFCLAVVLIFWKLESNKQFWVKKGVEQNNNKSIFGNILKILFRKQSVAEMIQEGYNMFPNTRYCGCYFFLTPTLIVKDPELIKQITVKDFDHFVNHASAGGDNADSFFSKTLFSLKNEKWRNMRTILSPSFTSSKMKFMFSLISQSGEQFVNHFLKKSEEIVTVEMKDIFTRFTNDVIANVAFGVEIDSLENPDNEFYLKGKSLTELGGVVKMLKFAAFFASPTFCKIFKISPFSKNDVDFFANIIMSNIRSREQHGIVRPDMITLLLQAKKDGIKERDNTGLVEESDKNTKTEEKIKLSDEDIVAQAISFFFAGFDSVAGLMSFMSYELGVNSDIQNKLIEEVDKSLDVCDGQITYEALHGMKYMDMVVSETLRKWPNSVNTDRLSTQPYTIEPKYPDEKAVHLEIGTNIWIPIYALHRDPKYYPDPEKFDPERFSNKNKEKIVPYTYLPFGVGPRSCIGSRLAIMETKVLFFYILSNFEIVPIKETQIPLKISRKQLNLIAEDGFWFGLKRRIK